ALPALRLGLYRANRIYLRMGPAARLSRETGPCARSGGSAPQFGNSQSTVSAVLARLAKHRGNGFRSGTTLFEDHLIAHLRIAGSPRQKPGGPKTISQPSAPSLLISVFKFSSLGAPMVYCHCSG